MRYTIFFEELKKEDVENACGECSEKPKCECLYIETSHSNMNHTTSNVGDKGGFKGFVDEYCKLVRRNGIKNTIDEIKTENENNSIGKRILNHDPIVLSYKNESKIGHSKIKYKKYGEEIKTLVNELNKLIKENNFDSATLTLKTIDENILISKKKRYHEFIECFENGTLNAKDIKENCPDEFGRLKNSANKIKRK